MSTSVNGAFRAFKHELEITLDDESQAIRRRDEIYERLRKDFDLLGEPLKSGSFSRDTKTRPLKDVDFLCVLRDTEDNRRSYRKKGPSVAIDAFADSLEQRYPGKVTPARRSVRVDFGGAERIQSYDVVPAFNRAEEDGYDIPDTTLARWIGTDPRVHARLATEANKRWGNRWKPLIKMIKIWNRKVKEDTGASAVKPSFLFEVIGYEHVEPMADDQYDLQVAFHTLASYVTADWPDPSGLGPGVNEMDRMTRFRACDLLISAGITAERARRLDREGFDRQAILVWRELFGSYMPVDQI